MTRTDHLTHGLLVRAADDELTSQEALQAELHLSGCEACRARLSELRLVSLSVQAMVASSVEDDFGEAGRLALRRQLERTAATPVKSGSWNVSRRFGWGVGLAAALAMSVLFVPRAVHPINRQVRAGSTALQTFEIGDERFVALPYSNAELPLGAPEIVQMRVPVSPLVDAGVYSDPGFYDGASDYSVLADVLLGSDGEPLGVNVLNGN